MHGSINAHPLSQSFKQSTPVFEVNYANQEYQKFALYSNKYRWLSTLCKNLTKCRVQCSHGAVAEDWGLLEFDAMPLC
jgi:hypothetical protein